MTFFFLVGNKNTRTTRRPPDHRKERRTAVVSTCLPFIRPGKNHLARHSERGKKTRQTEEQVGRQDQGMEFTKSQRAVENRQKWRKLKIKKIWNRVDCILLTSRPFLYHISQSRALFLLQASRIQLTQDKLNFLFFSSSVFMLYVAWKKGLPRKTFF